MNRQERDKLLSKQDKVADKLSELELLHEWTDAQRKRYESLEDEFQALEHELRG